MHQEISLKKFVRWRRLCTSTLDPRSFHHSEFGSPICTPADPVHGESIFIDLRAVLQVIDYARQHSLGVFRYFDRRLTGARAVHGEETYSEGQNGREAFRKIFLSAVEPVNCDHHRHCTRRVFRQPHITNDLFAFERNPYDFERWIQKPSMCAKCLQSFFVRAFFPRRSRNWPAPKRI